MNFGSEKKINNSLTAFIPTAQTSHSLQHSLLYVNVQHIVNFKADYLTD